MRLGGVCAIRTGYTARGRLESVADGVLAIQLRDVPTHGAVDPRRLSRVDLGEVPDRYRVRTGDVLFRSRGDKNTAAVLDGRLEEPAVAVLPLIVLRPNPDVVTPEFLAWAINQPAAQRHFDNTARGTSMRMVPRSSLDDLEIDLPDIATQRAIMSIDALADRERSLAVLAAEKRRQLASLFLIERASKTVPGDGHGRKAR